MTVKKQSKPSKPKHISGQEQPVQPGEESLMNPRPIFDDPDYKGSDKLHNKVALITGGDSGIGRSVAILFAKEGADVVIVYKVEDEDAGETRRYVEDLGRECITLVGDITDEEFCIDCVAKTIDEFGRLDILVNNAAVQYVQEDITKITKVQLQETFATNIFAQFYLVKAALRYLKPGSSIINTASITAYRGNPMLIDYASTKGAIISFTRSLAAALAKKGIRVNAVAPGPIWTPLIPASFPAKDVEGFGEDSPMGRPGQPIDVSPCYVFLASNDAAYMTGQVLHPNGGQPVNG